MVIKKHVNTNTPKLPIWVPIDFKLCDLTFTLYTAVAVCSLFLNAIKSNYALVSPNLAFTNSLFPCNLVLAIVVLPKSLKRYLPPPQTYESTLYDYDKTFFSRNLLIPWKIALMQERTSLDSLVWVFTPRLW